MKHLIHLAAVAALAVTFSGTAALACNPLLGKNFGKHVPPQAVPAAMLAKNAKNPPKADSIVGLWHVVHTASDGSLFLESFDQWAADGGEFELGNLPPSTGALCIGNWISDGKNIDLKTHVAWLYDTDNNWQGTLNMTQTNKLKKTGNEYTGTFDAKFFDTSGTQFMEITGTTAAERLVQ